MGFSFFSFIAFRGSWKALGSLLKPQVADSQLPRFSDLNYLGKDFFFFFLVCLSELGMNCLSFVPNKSVVWNRWDILQHKNGLENGQTGDVFCLQSGLALI